MKLLCERDVLNKLSWPSRSYINARIKSDGFPKPTLRMHGIGDQWREDLIDRWLGVEERQDGTAMLIERFKAMGKAG